MSVLLPERKSRGVVIGQPRGMGMGETFRHGNWRDGNWQEPFFQEPFSKAEMDAARRALREEEGLLADVLARVRKLARALPFSEDILAAYHCVRDPSTPTRVRITLLAALAYFVMPADAIPDIIPILGFTDDAAVLAAALASVQGSILPGHRDKARAMLQETVDE